MSKRKIDPDLLEMLEGTSDRLDKNSGSSSEFRYWSPKSATIRILPGPEGSSQFFFEGWAHWNTGPKKERVTCPRLTNGLDQPCAVCDYIELLSRSDDSEDNKLAKKMKRSLRPQYYMNILIRGEEEEGLRIWSAPPTVFKIIKRDVRGEYGAVWDIEEGTDFVVKRDDSGEITDYSQSHFKRFDSPLLDDEGDITVEEVLDRVCDFDDFIEVPDYDSTKAVLKGEKRSRDVEEEEEEVVEEEPEEDDDVSRRLEELRNDL